MVLCILHEKIKKNRISRECIAYGGEEICLHGSVGNLKQSDCLKNLGVDGRIILKDVFFLLARQLPVDHGLLIHEVSRSHTTTHHSQYDSSGRVISSS